MSTKRKKRNTRQAPRNSENVPPDMNHDQAGVSMGEKNRTQRSKDQKTAGRRVRKRPIKPVTTRKSGTDKTYHRRSRKPDAVNPFTMKEAKRQARIERHLKYRREDSGKTADIIYKLLLAAAIIGIVVFTLGVFFGVETISAENSRYYYESEIIRASGIEQGDKLLFINRSRVYDNITKELPFVRSARIKIKFPTTVTIEVVERDPTVKLVCGGFEYILADDGILLDATVIRNNYDVPKIISAAPTEAVLGKKLVFETEVVGATLDEVIAQLIMSPISSKIGTINMEKVYDISFIYDERFEIRIGDTVDIDKKMKMLNEVIKRLGNSATGIIDARNPDMIRWRSQPIA